VDLAHALKLTVCAEGVESLAMFEFVRDAGFDTAQGRFFSEPVKGGDIERIVRGWPSSGTLATGMWRHLESSDLDPEDTDRAILTGYAEGDTRK
jgi:predicted signal transduction protein with EAL and GGDEF domain